MSIIKSKKHASETPQADAKSLAHAYEMKKRNSKKMYAKGGKVESDMDHGQKRGPQGYGKYQEQAQNEKGVHTPVSGTTQYPNSKGHSEAGDHSSSTYGGKPHRELRDHGKDLHKKKLAEMKSMPKPKLQGLAKGGEVESRATEVLPDKGHGKIIRVGLAEGGPVAPRPKIEASKPKMANSSVIKARPVDALGNVLKDREEHLMDLDPEKHEGMSEDHTQPVDEYMADQAEMFARGGEVEMPDDEVQEEHHTSIAAAIMAKKQRQMALDSDSDDDIEVLMAEGGQVDIDSNNEEQANAYDHQNHAALKENYDEDMDDVSQPMDSNEHSDDIDSDKHDMITVIRRKMNSRRQF